MGKHLREVPLTRIVTRPDGKSAEPYVEDYVIARLAVCSGGKITIGVGPDVDYQIVGSARVRVDIKRTNVRTTLGAILIPA